MALVRITNAILGNENYIIPVSTYDEKNDIYIGLPTIIGKDGARRRIRLKLNIDEQQKLQHNKRKLKIYRRIIMRRIKYFIALILSIMIVLPNVYAEEKKVTFTHEQQNVINDNGELIGVELTMSFQGSDVVAIQHDIEFDSEKLNLKEVTANGSFTLTQGELKKKGKKMCIITATAASIAATSIALVSTAVSTTLVVISSNQQAKAAQRQYE